MKDQEDKLDSKMKELDNLINERSVGRKQRVVWNEYIQNFEKYFTLAVQYYENLVKYNLKLKEEAIKKGPFCDKARAPKKYTITTPESRCKAAFEKYKDTNNWYEYQFKYWTEFDNNISSICSKLNDDPNTWMNIPQYALSEARAWCHKAYTEIKYISAVNNEPREKRYEIPELSKHVILEI